MDSGFVTNGEVRLHYLASGRSGTPLLVAPGLSDSAGDYADLLEALAPHRAVAMSFRGQGRSDVPRTGYDLEDHASDIAAIVNALELDPVVIFAHSRAVAHAIAYAATDEGRVAALILGDSGAVHRAFPPEWIDDFAGSKWRGQAVSERISRTVLEGIQREARQVELWETLAGLSARRYAILGGTHPPDHLERVTARHREAGAEVVVLDDAGHALWEPDLERFVSLLRDLVAATGGSRTNP